MSMKRYAEVDPVGILFACDMKPGEEIRASALTKTLTQDSATGTRW